MSPKTRLFPETNPLASLIGQYPTSLTTFHTRRARRGSTVGMLLRVRDTVAVETLALDATSRMSIVKQLPIFIDSTIFGIRLLPADAAPLRRTRARTCGGESSTRPSQVKDPGHRVRLFEVENDHADR